MSVGGGVDPKGLFIYLLLLYSSSFLLLAASSSSVLRSVLDVGFPQSLLSLFQAAAPLCSDSATLGSFRPLISFFFFLILIKEAAESGIPAARFYYT